MSVRGANGRIMIVRWRTKSEIGRHYRIFLASKKMEEVLVSDEVFDKIDFRQNALPTGEYEDCTFNNCDFSETDLSAIKFIDCDFSGCNLSLAKISRTVFQNAKFKNCKMLGLHFDECSEFLLSFRFENCVLNHSSFYKTRIKKTHFKDSQLRETDFTECDLSEAVFEKCDLARATFENTNLEKADFRTAFNYSFDPDFNRVRKAKFSLSGVSGLLDKYDIKIDR